MTGTYREGNLAAKNAKRGIVEQRRVLPKSKTPAKHKFLLMYRSPRWKPDRWFVCSRHHTEQDAQHNLDKMLRVLPKWQYKIVPNI
jgi:hypothetical protein